MIHKIDEFQKSIEYTYLVKRLDNSVKIIIYITKYNIYIYVSISDLLNDKWIHRYNSSETFTNLTSAKDYAYKLFFNIEPLT